MRMTHFATVLILFLMASPAVAHGPDGHENLKVIPEAKEKELKPQMKALAKGIGVRCDGCHVKGEFSADDKPGKIAAREFFKAVWAAKSVEEKEAALAKLLETLKVKKAKSPKQIWAALDALKPDGKMPHHDGKDHDHHDEHGHEH